MENLNITQLEKRIKILLEWKSVLLCLAEDELSPYDKQCAEKELSREVQHFITNLCMLYNIRLHPDQSNLDVQKSLKTLKNNSKLLILS
ncbi:hypothetical protein WGM54_10335 [Paenibacillus polymyxa]|uniref:hypothetical protein n=1 Tax=Paenibacillus polymyxa TaxID=1406 RepID=UPI00307F0FED